MARPASQQHQQLYFSQKPKLSKGASKSNRSSTSSVKSNSSNRRCAFTRKVARLVKEQRAKFYIVRRCVTMLICWREYRDDDSEENDNQVLD